MLWFITNDDQPGPPTRKSQVNPTRSTLCADGRILIEHIDTRTAPFERRLRTNHSSLGGDQRGGGHDPSRPVRGAGRRDREPVLVTDRAWHQWCSVVNERGLPVGMVSKTDIVRHRYENGETEAGEGATVGELMVPIAFTLLEGATLGHAAALMAWEGVHRIPICSDAGDVIGIISALDVVRWLSRAEGYPVRTASALAGPRS